jgi:hypothetical protein
MLLSADRAHFWARPHGFRPITTRGLDLAAVLTLDTFQDAQQLAAHLRRTLNVTAVPTPIRFIPRTGG